MKHKVKTRLLALLFCGGLLSGFCVSYAAPAPSTVHADYWKGELVMNGDRVPTSFANEKGERVYVFSYSGTIYLPLRTAGEWLGKQVAWDGATRTVSLSGASTERSELSPATPEEEARRDAALADGIDVLLDPGISVTVDGVKQNFVNANGEAVYPVVYNGSTYLPLRSVGELMGMEVGWIAYEDGDSKAFLRTPLTGEESRELKAFLDAALPITGQLEALCNSAMKLNYSEPKDPAGSEAAIRQVRDLLGQLDALPKLETEFGGTWYSEYYLPMLAQYLQALDAGLARLDGGAKLADVMEEDDAALSRALQRTWQTLPSFVNKIDLAYWQGDEA